MTGARRPREADPCTAPPATSAKVADGEAIAKLRYRSNCICQVAKFAHF